LEFYLENHLHIGSDFVIIGVWFYGLKSGFEKRLEVGLREDEKKCGCSIQRCIQAEKGV